MREVGHTCQELVWKDVHVGIQRKEKPGCKTLALPEVERDGLLCSMQKNGPVIVGVGGALFYFL